MKLFITNLPSFYKINLYNKINETKAIYVVFTGEDSEGRNADFYKGDIHFQYISLGGNKWTKALYVAKLLILHKWDEVIIGGWNSLSYWSAAFFSSKRRTSVAVESSIFESSIVGRSARIKRLFLKKVSKVYASGKPHERLVRALGFKGTVIITHGVGVFNYIKQPIFIARNEVKNFIYVGRLVDVKNLHFLIEQFNRHPNLSLSIIGFGVEEEELKSLAGDNIRFFGAVDNKKLPEYYQKNDVFVLPSRSEPWGLVVEEALNNGLPVMLSNKVGCHEDLANEGRGVVFDLTADDFEEKLAIITNVEMYNEMRKAVSNIDFETIERNQVSCYTE